MLVRFREFIKKEHLLVEGQRVLLAVSGGRDSVAMCELMSQAGFAFGIAHCNFHLRPGDCDRDEEFVLRLAKKYNVPCYVREFDTILYASQHSLSIEEAARQLRYGFFDEIAKKESYSAISTAHHRDDAIETFFINLLRGTGISGLHGIKPRNGNVVRPMLAFGRNEIDDFVQEHGLKYVDDYTNMQAIYLRNKIRLNLIPLLREIQPSFDRTMQSNMAHIAEADTVYGYAIDLIRSKYVVENGNGIDIDFQGLRALDLPLNTVLHELLSPYGFNSAIVADVVSSLAVNEEKRFLSESYVIIKTRSLLRVRDVESQNDMAEGGCVTIGSNIIQEPVPLSFSVINADGFSPKLPASQACFDFDRLHFPLHLRHWKDGDRLCPYGMKGSRLVGNLFIERKMSGIEKRNQWLLCDADDRVLWVVGIRASADCAVSQTTRKVLLVSMG